MKTQEEDGVIHHQPVLVERVVSFVRHCSPSVIFDGTVGLGGHARRILTECPFIHRYVGLDWDGQALERARDVLQPFTGRILLRRESFERMAAVADETGLRPEFVLLDLGTSLLQLRDFRRGFSFSGEGPLDMRMDDRAHRSLARLIEESDSEEIRDILERFGEVRYARRLARAIKSSMTATSTTMDLVRVVESALPKGFLSTRRRHPATAVFQAFRIAVNDELGVLERALPSVFELLVPGGILAVISFHSLEDRLVKVFMRKQTISCVCPPALAVCGCTVRARGELITRKPVRPSLDEIRTNPPSRSARLRVLRKQS